MSVTLQSSSCPLANQPQQLGVFQKLASISLISLLPLGCSSSPDPVPENLQISKLTHTTSDPYLNLPLERRLELIRLEYDVLQKIDRGTTISKAVASIPFADRTDFISYLRYISNRNQPEVERATLFKSSRRLAMLEVLTPGSVPLLRLELEHAGVANLCKAALSWDASRDSILSLDLKSRGLARLIGSGTPRDKAVALESYRTLDVKSRLLPIESVQAFINDAVTYSGAYSQERSRNERAEAAQPILCNPFLPSQTIKRMAIHLLTESTQGGEARVLKPQFSGSSSESWSIEYDLLLAAPSITLRNTTVNNMFVTVPFDKFLELASKGSLPELLCSARQSYNNEHSEPRSKTLREFDLPRSEPFVYLRVNPESFDSVLASTLTSGMLMARTLSFKYPQAQIAPPCFSDDPLAEIKSIIDTAVKLGTRTFFIDFNCHGAPDSLGYQTPITPEQLAKLFKTYPKECKFIVTSIACFGGGLIPGFQVEFDKSPELRSRVMVIAQTKQGIVNEVAHVKVGRADDIENDHLVGSYYSNSLVYFLLQDGISFGEACHRADLHAKRSSKFDASLLFNGELFSRAPGQSKDFLELSFAQPNRTP